jgi:hypothetical protein
MQELFDEARYVPDRDKHINRLVRALHQRITASQKGSSKQKTDQPQPKTSSSSTQPKTERRTFFTFKNPSTTSHKSQNKSKSTSWKPPKESSSKFSFPRSAPTLPKTSTPKPPATPQTALISIPEDIQNLKHFASIVNLFNAHKDAREKITASEAQRRLMNVFHADNMQEMKSAYKKLVIKLHPDKTKDYTPTTQTYLENIFKFVSHYYELATKKTIAL